MKLLRFVIDVFIAASLLFLTSCTDHSSPTAPVDPRTAVLFQAMWPHDDGRGWAYRLTSRSWDQSPSVLYPNRGDVPTISLDGAIRLLGVGPTGANLATSTGSYRLQFNGSVTTLSGVSRQNLEATLEQGAAARVASNTASFAQAGSGFLELLRRARPDLARKMGPSTSGVPARITSTPAGAATVFLPTLLHGYAWEQTDQWIGTYGDLNQGIAWIFLTPDLRPGSGFTLQLVPDLADDVFLHARVLGWKSVVTDAGMFRRALDVAYLVDFGVDEIVDPDGNTLGYTRSSLFGTVDFVVGVGPVRSYERLNIAADPLNRGNSDQTASLTGTLTGIP